MTLERKRRPSTPASPIRYYSGLKRLGVPIPRKKKRGCIWLMLSDSALWDLLESARNAWRRQAKLTHPDRGGDARQFASMASSWAAVKRSFAHHGYELGR